jgi:hypothetical protein
MPLYQLYEEMTYEELLGWLNYFERRPVGWRSDDAAAKMLQAQGVDRKPWELFSSLDPIYNPQDKPEEGAFNVSAFKRSGLFGKLLQATGGETILGG